MKTRSPMKKVLILSFIFLSFTSFCQKVKDSTKVEQTDQSIESIDTIKFQQIFKCRNSVQLELLGSGSLYSLNYERILINGHRWKTAASAGLCYLKAPTWSGFVIPVMISEMYSLKNHHIVLGLGASPNYASNTVYGNSFEVFLSGRFGYRFQKPTGRMLFAIHYTPILIPETRDFGNWGGITFGFTF